MPYSTVEQMTAAFSEAELRSIADHDGDREIDEQVIVEAIRDADGVIEALLAQYMPFSAGMLRSVQTWSKHIAAHYLRATRNMDTTASQFLYEEAMRAMQLLRAVDADDIVVPPSDPNAGDPEADEYERLWTRDTARRVL